MTGLVGKIASVMRFERGWGVSVDPHAPDVPPWRCVVAGPLVAVVTVGSALISFYVSCLALSQPQERGSPLAKALTGFELRTAATAHAEGHA
ncbi:MAG: hypothetical protein H0W96_04365 [Solirubrobacterales bacterium]|nr:hypothetical protein [Solirubrobacterales bacterium]